jgi:tRNA uracil 4-sulfurtransferase
MSIFFMKEKALLLISGGIDSPVAGLIAKQKYDLYAIHFSQTPFTDNTPEKKSIASVKKLGIKELIIIEAGDELKEIADKTYREYYFVLMKRFFVKVSEQVAHKNKIKFLVTGESLGQVSSQTLSNLNTINLATKGEILRPLLFLDKQEIIDISKENDFYNISTGPEMCDALATGKPKTLTKIENVLEEERKCEMRNLVNNAIKKIRIEKV